jgi:hypothetical protein
MALRFPIMSLQSVSKIYPHSYFHLTSRTQNVQDKDSVAPAFLYSDHEPLLPEPAILSASASTDKHPSPKPPINRANVDEIDNSSHLPEGTQFTPTARSSMKRRRQLTSENIALVPNLTASKRAVRGGDTTLDDVCVEISD